MTVDHFSDLFETYICWLRLFDVILRVNDTDLTQVKRQDAIIALRDAGEDVKLVSRR